MHIDLRYEENGRFQEALKPFQKIRHHKLLLKITITMVVFCSVLVSERRYRFFESMRSPFTARSTFARINKTRTFMHSLKEQIECIKNMLLPRETDYYFKRYNVSNIASRVTNNVHNVNGPCS